MFSFAGIFTLIATLNGCDARQFPQSSINYIHPCVDIQNVTKGGIAMEGLFVTCDVKMGELLIDEHAVIAIPIEQATSSEIIRQMMILKQNYPSFVDSLAPTTLQQKLNQDGITTAKTTTRQHSNKLKTSIAIDHVPKAEKLQQNKVSKPERTLLLESKFRTNIDTWDNYFTMFPFSLKANHGFPITLVKIPILHRQYTDCSNDDVCKRFGMKIFAATDLNSSTELVYSYRPTYYDIKAQGQIVRAFKPQEFKCQLSSCGIIWDYTTLPCCKSKTIDDHAAIVMKLSAGMFNDLEELYRVTSTPIMMKFKKQAFSNGGINIDVILLLMEVLNNENWNSETVEAVFGTSQQALDFIVQHKIVRSKKNQIDTLAALNMSQVLDKRSVLKHYSQLQQTLINCLKFSNVVMPLLRNVSQQIVKLTHDY